LVKVARVAPRELGEAEFGAWRELIGSDTRFWSPFLTPRFSQIIGEHRPDSRVAVLEDGPRVVGFLPYERDPERVGLPLGGGMNDAQAMIAPRDLEWDLAGLVRRLGLRVWRFDHLLPDQALFSQFHETRHSSPTVDLSDGLDAYRAAVREQSSVLQQTARKRRQIDRDIGPVTFEWQSTDPGLLDTLIRWKALQYERTNVHNLFAAPWSVAALHEFFESDDPECSGLLSVLRAGDRVLAVHFGVTRGPVLHYWFPAYDAEHSTFSPGLVLLLDMITAAPDHGISLVDLGRGDQGYKRRVANDEYLVAEGRVPARGRVYRAALLTRHPAWLGRRVQSWRRRSDT
jgi:CelD/BcsL family acetyltransferase involved in cellulose biosynthesis